MTIFFIEIELETHQMEISEENVAYSMGKFEAYIRLRNTFLNVPYKSVESSTHFL